MAIAQLLGLMPLEMRAFMRAMIIPSLQCLCSACQVLANHYHSWSNASRIFLLFAEANAHEMPDGIELLISLFINDIYCRLVEAYKFYIRINQAYSASCLVVPGTFWYKQ